MSATMVNDCNQPIVVESPGTSPIWLSTNIQQFSDQDFLPGIRRWHKLTCLIIGTVRPDGVFPQPPPRYSSLGDIIERNSANGRRTTSANAANEAKP